jgi:hypothetical protein
VLLINDGTGQFSDQSAIRFPQPQHPHDSEDMGSAYFDVDQDRVSRKAAKHVLIPQFRTKVRTSLGTCEGSGTPRLEKRAAQSSKSYLSVTSQFGAFS